MLITRWESLKAQAAGRRGALEEALGRANNFHQHWKALIDWLADAERRAYADWKPCALPETCQAEITKHQVWQNINEISDYTLIPMQACNTEKLGMGNGTKSKCVFDC